jgi:hypothetical protein
VCEAKGNRLECCRAGCSAVKPPFSVNPRSRSTTPVQSPALHQTPSLPSICLSLSLLVAAVAIVASILTEVLRFVAFLVAFFSQPPRSFHSFPEPHSISSASELATLWFGDNIPATLEPTVLCSRAFRVFGCPLSNTFFEKDLAIRCL